MLAAPLLALLVSCSADPETADRASGATPPATAQAATPNLEKHRSLLVGTRDRINSWMQDHPDDYR